MKDGKRLRQKSIDILEHINEEVNRAYMVKIELNYQKKELRIPQKVADERIKIIEEYIEKIRNSIIKKHKTIQTVKIIQKYFENNSTKCEFKI